MSKPFPCCQCNECQVCAALLNSHFYGSLCSVTMVDIEALGASAAQQAHNDAAGAAIQTMFNNLEYDLTYSPPTYEPETYSWNSISQLGLADMQVGSSGETVYLDFGGWDEFEIIDPWLVFGCQWQNASSPVEPCHPKWYWWFGCEFERVASPSNNLGKRYQLFGPGSGASSSASSLIALSVSDAFPYPPPAALASGGIEKRDCATPPSSFSSDRYSDVSGLLHPFASADFLLTVSSTPATAPACPP